MPLELPRLFLESFDLASKLIYRTIFLLHLSCERLDFALKCLRPSAVLLPQCLLSYLDLSHCLLVHVETFLLLMQVGNKIMHSWGGVLSLELT